VTKHKYETVTRNIRVAVTPSFLEDQSEPSEGRYLWSYHITIENKGGETVQLLSRYWRITDARGRVREVRGAGVVGEQPVIQPGRAFEYTSGAPLETPSGFMTGTYQMRASSGESFEINIPLFALESPYEARRMH
jgi:ApaG protein